MKLSSLKTIFSTFAFTMAIVASFAFSPALNGAEYDPVNGYIQVLELQSCDKVTHDCIEGTAQDCTIQVVGGAVAVFGIRHPANTTCSNQLTQRP